MSAVLLKKAAELEERLDGFVVGCFRG